MIKNINQYLLTNYPVVWNLKILYIGLIVLLSYFIFLFLGYILTTPVVHDYSYSASGTYVLATSASVLTAILIFIFWMVQYNRNNALRAYYPQSTLSLYTEWLLIFIFCSLICFIPACTSWGKMARWSSTVSVKEYNEANQVIEQVRMLLPSNDHYYTLNTNHQPLMVGNANVDRTRFNTGLYTYEEDAATPDNPIEYIGPSLLYYDGGYRYGDSENINQDKTHRWLVEQKKDSIQATMQAFIDLHKKHKLNTNLDVDTWMTIVYNPPLYPISDNSLIQGGSYYTTTSKEKHTELDALTSFYREASNNQTNGSAYYWGFLIPFVTGLGLSVMVFSSRATSGRSWIFALLSLGVILFIFFLLLGFLSLIGLMDIIKYASPLFWLGFSVLLGVLLIIKVTRNDSKGFSRIYFNLFVWTIPAIVPLLSYIYVALTEYKADTETLFFTVFMISIVFSLIAMCFVAMITRLWKALPEN